MALLKHEALSPDEMREILRKFIAKHGTLGRAADMLSSSGSHLSEILAGKREIGDSIAAQLGYQHVKTKKVVSVIYYIGAKR